MVTALKRVQQGAGVTDRSKGPVGQSPCRFSKKTDEPDGAATHPLLAVQVDLTVAWFMLSWGNTLLFCILRAIFPRPPFWAMGGG